MSSNNLFQAHTQWANRPQDQRFSTLEELAEAVHNRRLRSRSIDLDCNRLEVKSESNILTINGTITPCEPSHWSFGQLSSLVGAPAGYLRTLPQDLIVKNLNHGLQNSGRETVKFMTVEEPNSGSNTLQAVTSKTYGRIWDADCVAAVQRIRERSGGKFTNPLAYAHRGDPNGFKTIDATRQVPSGLYASDRDVFMFLIDGGSLLDAGPRAQLNRGFFCWNSEVGARTFGLTTFLFNVVCGNHIVWGAQQVNELVIRHTSGGPARFDSEAMPVLLDYANASAAPQIEAIKRAQDYRLFPAGTSLENQDSLVRDWANKHGKFSRSELTESLATAKREEGDCATLWQLVQGLTAYARGFDYVDARVDLETRAGKLLAVVNN